MRGRRDRGKRKVFKEKPSEILIVREILGNLDVLGLKRSRIIPTFKI